MDFPGADGTNDCMQKIALGPAATRSYDIMRGGFVWTTRSPAGVPIEAIADRASVSLGAPDPRFEGAIRTRDSDPRFEGVRQRVAQTFPTWPGLRKERPFGQVQRDLKAVRLRADRLSAQLEHAD